MARPQLLLCGLLGLLLATTLAAAALGGRRSPGAVYSVA
jgi:hypothetical protein